jgi:hypothetical protein
LLINPLLVFSSLGLALGGGEMIRAIITHQPNEDDQARELDWLEILNKYQKKIYAIQSK